MTQEQKEEITKISKSFTKGLDIPIESSGWLITDPLSAFLDVCRYKNTVLQIPKTTKNPLVLIIVFEDGSKFIPAGGDLRKVNKGFVNWMWL